MPGIIRHPYPSIFALRCRRLAHTILTISASCQLAGCSVLSGPEDHTESLPLESTAGQVVSCQRNSLSGPPYVYRCGITAHNQQSSDVFVTMVRDCSIPERFTTQATTRQLLVGLTDINVIKQTGIELSDSRALLSIIKAQLDATPVALAAITQRSQSTNHSACISDLVMWKTWESDAEAESLESMLRLVASSSHFAGAEAMDGSN